MGRPEETEAEPDDNSDDPLHGRSRLLGRPRRHHGWRSYGVLRNTNVPQAAVWYVVLAKAATECANV